ncbi:MAG: ATP-dependent Clp protease ATP-binding subunit, partial [Clostridia bacterium]|nr:ATP-dependent Clp protease ATP-binding subunit [Clostridia bacterium]
PAAGFNATERAGDEAKVRKALEDFLRPEFINRVDDIIVFNRLSVENCADIAMIMLSDLAKTLEEKGIKLTYTRAEAELIAQKGFDRRYGARNLRRVIQTDIEDIAAARIIDSYGDPVKEIILRSPVRDGASVECEFIHQSQNTL